METKDRKTRRAEGTKEKVGEGVGGVGGALAGAGLGSLAGPVGTILGGIAGAVGGWWAGEKVGRSLEDWSDEEDRWYRDHFRRNPTGTIETYDEARVGYVIGSMAGRNPDYRSRRFEEIEPDLRHGFQGDYDYDEFRPYVREGWNRTTAG